MNTSVLCYVFIDSGRRYIGTNVGTNAFLLFAE